MWESRLLGIVAATLVVFGVAAVYGASSIWAVQSGHPGSYFALRQLLGAVLGMVLLLVAARIDYHMWQQYAWPLLGVVVVLLVVPLLPFTRAIAPEVNGARRWITVGPATLQPSELAKLAAVAWTAMLAVKKGPLVREFKRGLLPFVVVLVPIAMLILLEPDLSTAAVTVLLAGLVLFAAGARIGHFLLLGIVMLPLLWHEIVSAQYRLARMVSFLSSGGDVAESNWQIQQSLIGIGAGRVLGVGFGEGLQKLGYLPYAYSDFIFSTIGEEWGFFGVALVIALLGLYLGLGFRVARTAADPFGKLLATGLTAMIGIAALLHIGVTLAIVPTTGIPLPFISYGRSSLLVSLVATGIIINIADRRIAAGKRR
jgi:cell division protein FtsW